MEGYFPKAKEKKDLDPSQQERYDTLVTTPTRELPPKLQERLVFIKEYIGPITSGEIWSAHNELAEDAVVNWILSEEDPLQIKWTEPRQLKASQFPPTEEEKRKAQEWWENFKRDHEEWRQRQARLDAKALFDYRFGWIQFFMGTRRRRLTSLAAAALLFGLLYPIRFLYPTSVIADGLGFIGLCYLVFVSTQNR